MVSNLGERLVEHNQNPVEYYGQQLEKAQLDLARVSLIYSGQMEFDFTETVTPDYSSQLDFHRQELDDAEKRGFPPAQTAYHEAKVISLTEIIGEGNGRS